MPLCNLQAVTYPHDLSNSRNQRYLCILLYIHICMYAQVYFTFDDITIIIFNDNIYTFSILIPSRQFYFEIKYRMDSSSNEYLIKSKSRSSVARLTFPVMLRITTLPFIVTFLPRLLRQLP